jgi:hypothetical protein
MLSRTVTGKYGKFERISLEKGEIDGMMNNLLEHNFRELDRITTFLATKGIKNSERPELLPILAERQLTSSFQIWANELDEKVFRFKQQQYKYVSKAEADKVKDMVKHGLGEGEKPAEENKEAK